MARFEHVWKHYFPNRTSPETYVERYLIKLEKLDKEMFEFWQDYQAYLGAQRENLSEEIADSLLIASQQDLEVSAYRIVTSNYGEDPLCTYGSILDAGRFNFGVISSFHKDFDCLYIGDSPATCYQEKFHYSQDENIDGLSGADVALIPSHNTVRVNVKLASYLDLHEPENLHAFLKVVSKIKTPEEFQRRREKIHKRIGEKCDPLGTIQGLDALIISIFDPSFKQTNTLMDLPSNSQWLGHYVRQAGVQAIKYPSVRQEGGFNLAIYPINFEGTDSFVKLVDQMPYVPTSRMVIDETNCHFIRLSRKQLKELEMSSKN
jgi:hypothetical protein